MIRKEAVLERARAWQLRPEVVEKDYVLGRLLAAVSRHQETATTWVLKGGTCIKKCFLETYRFSEDLDFSLLPDAEYSLDGLRTTLLELADIAGELSGIEFNEAEISVRARVDKLGRETFEGKIGYRGPLRAPNWPRILFDLTAHEPVVDEPTQRSILHDYPDALGGDAFVSTYSIEELIAEKTRALYERARPRDLYDVVYVLANAPGGIDLARARDIFDQKCEAKNLPRVRAAAVLERASNSPELRSEWANMLAHQLPQLPPMDAMLENLRRLVGWIADGPVTPAIPVLPPPPMRGGEALIAAGSFVHGISGSHLEHIRFAGANRLVLRFSYDGSSGPTLRTVEPYSLRVSSRGNTLLYAWEIANGQIKAFDLDKMSQVEVTRDAFHPRYQIEFAAAGPIRATPAAERSSRIRYARPARNRSGPVYVFTCPVCQKEFRHRRNNAHLRRHKAKDDDWYCSGHLGYYTRTEH